MNVKTVGVEVVEVVQRIMSDDIHIHTLMASWGMSEGTVINDRQSSELSRGGKPRCTQQQSS